MEQRENLIDIMAGSPVTSIVSYESTRELADYLLANGVVVLPSGVDDADELAESILHCLEIADSETVCEQCKQDHL